jgi:opacity protein-like surface antigen
MDKLAKIKFVLLMGGGLLLTEQVHAKFDGFYVGGSLGYLQQNTSINAAQNPANPHADIYKSTAGRAMPVTELFLGWGKVVGGQFYIGVEGQIDLIFGGSKKVAEDTNFIYHSGRKGPGYVFLGRSGYLVFPQTLIYIGIGAKLAKYTYNIHEKSDCISACFAKRYGHFFSEFGLEFMPTSNNRLAYRIAYNYMPGRYINRSTMNFPQNHMYNDKGVFKSEVSEHAVKIGLVYRF